MAVRQPVASNIITPRETHPLPTAQNEGEEGSMKVVTYRHHFTRVWVANRDLAYSDQGAVVVELGERDVKGAQSFVFFPHVHHLRLHACSSVSHLFGHLPHAGTFVFENVRLVFLGLQHARVCVCVRACAGGRAAVGMSSCPVVGCNSVAWCRIGRGR